MIRFHDVYKRYPGGGEALRGLNLHLPAGQMAFLTGHSGAGKSTLLRLVTGVERSTRGQVVVGGHSLTRLPRRLVGALRRNIGVVFQNHRLLMDRTIFDNVALPLVIAGYRHDEIRRRVRAALDAVALLGKERALPVTLSGGEQQRVGIARAVVHRPALLLADEPTGNLDRVTAGQVFELMLELNREVGTSLVVATHDPAISARMDRTVRLIDGALQMDAAPPAANP